MLCTNHWIDKYLGFVPRKLDKEELAVIREQKKNEPRDFPYLPTMENHPCTIWARTSLSNYEWLFCYALALDEEEGLKGDGAVEAYRRFYHKDKATFASWTYRDKPPWWDEDEADYEARISR